MVSIEDLARQVSETHGIDTHAAAVAVVSIHVDAIADDPDLWDADTAQPTDDGAVMIREAIAESYRIGAIATTAQHLLAQIEAKTAEIAAAEQRVKDLTGERDDLIRAALRTELRRDDIATAANLKPARLYQIRDRRR